MIVLDAAALVELVLATPLGFRIADRIAAPELGLHVPHLADIEVAHVLRRHVANGKITTDVAFAKLQVYRELDLERHAHEWLLDRVWELRDNLTAYDAVYVALAESLPATLLTCDKKLALAPGLDAEIECVCY